MEPSGVRLRPTSPDPVTFDIVDQAHHLARQCRYAGGINREWYSVAEHAVHVLELLRMSATGMYTRSSLRTGVGPVLYRIGNVTYAPSAWLDLQRWALVHDNTEAFLGDVTRPLKRQPDMAGYRTVERAASLQIAKWLGITPSEPEVVKDLDTAILGTEMRRFKSYVQEGSIPPDRFPRERWWNRWGWSPKKAARVYLACFVELWGPDALTRYRCRAVTHRQEYPP